MNDVKVVVPGDYIGTGFVSGHGTYVNPDNKKEIYDSLAGVVNHIDQVVCVRPVRQGYRPDVGDVVVGRVVSVEQSRWSVDINSYRHAVLNLTSINLPGRE